MKIFSLNCNGRLLQIDQPIIMGILNATPDSFYNQGRDSSFQSIIDAAGKMLEEGATVLDVGGMSTRSKATVITELEEQERTLKIIETIKKIYPDCFISIDTYRSKVAEAAVLAGANIINDISAGSFDENMLDTVAKLNVPFVAMHIQGTPETMQDNPQYKNVSQEVISYFVEKIKAFKAAGIKDYIIDPGFGFGKTLEHNYQLLTEMHTLSMFGCPVMAGISRKSMVYKLLQTSPDEALNGTTALHILALNQGANILRVHDVKEAKEVINIWEYVCNIKKT